jgi:chorismate dehydratase
MDGTIDQVHGLDRERYGVGGVRFLNARPMLYGLSDHKNIDLEEAPPSHLAAGMESGKFCAALVPSIDYQMTQADWRVLPVAAIGSKGDVLTVRVFSKRPLIEIEEIACDADSHTSVVLSQVIWHLRYRRKVRIRPLSGSIEEHSTVLLIGDKVIPHLNRWPHELDLGRAWDEATGLPFVYAFWALPNRGDLMPLAEILQLAVRTGLDNIDAIVSDCAGHYGFTRELAKQYLTQNLSFRFGQKEMNGLSRFYQCAAELGLIPEWKKLTLFPMSQISETV